MLVLTRKVNEVVWIGPGIRVVVVRLEGGQVRLGIEADKSVGIWREEVAGRRDNQDHNSKGGAL